MRRIARTFAALAVAMAVGLGSTTVATAAPTVSGAAQSDRAHPERTQSHRAATVEVGGSVATPLNLTAEQLAALPQTTLPLQRLRGTAGDVTGASVVDVIAAAGPRFDSGKNPSLRAAVTVVGAHGRSRTFAYGELDLGFGNHPALLVAGRSGVDLVVPGDTTRLRSVAGVRKVVLTTLPAPVSVPAAGSVQVTDGRRTVTLSARTLSRLPARTVSVEFSAGGVPQQHTETGPSLALVQLVAGFLPAPDTLVTAVADDGYGAAVTNGEALLGGRPLLLSLAEDGAPLDRPRLVVDGDLKGGRYVSGVVTLLVTR